MTVYIFTDNLLLVSAFSNIIKDLGWNFESHRVAELEGRDFEPEDSGILLLSLPFSSSLSRLINRIAANSPGLSIILFTDELNAADIAGMSIGIRAIVPTCACEERIKSILTLVADGHTVLPAGNCAITGAPQVVSLPPQAQARQLTNRELQILQHIAKGYSNKAIARLLQISTSTVQVHASAIFRKLDVENRTQAARLFDGITTSAAMLSKGPRVSPKTRHANA
ncbi:response regulator transcription factor [Histidinibacterium aquaticum]|uniref:Response regulator transcription factor n=1 Tax=Histidinibacterium aquaticum TaxID=2613962 RepID=A0A5J5GAW2_9RHOB|nr:response regulator transcription factor [Histidinibacterium aquaticum]KAA9005070.1 response regulator transcription factor [Histidinibacterium aquaticum]